MNNFNKKFCILATIILLIGFYGIVFSAQQKYANHCKTTLAADISSSATSLTLTSATGFPTLSAGDWFLMHLVKSTDGTKEIVKVTAISGTTCTIVRAQEGTSAIAHTASPTTIASLRPTAGTFGRFEQGLTDLDILEAIVAAFGDIVSQNKASIDIDGGAIDGTPIGANSASTGAFTTLTASTDPTDANGVGDRAFNDGRYFQQTGNVVLNSSSLYFQGNAVTPLSGGSLLLGGSNGVTISNDGSITEAKNPFVKLEFASAAGIYAGTNPIDFDTIDIDQGSRSLYNTTTHIFTPPVSGLYRVSGFLPISNTSGWSGSGQARLDVGFGPSGQNVPSGVGRWDSYYVGDGSTYPPPLFAVNFSFVVNLTAASTYQFYTFLSGTGAVVLYGGSQSGAYAEIEKIR